VRVSHVGIVDAPERSDRQLRGVEVLRRREGVDAKPVRRELALPDRGVLKPEDLLVDRSASEPARAWVEAQAIRLTERRP
jgi:hypothetical protein